MRRKRAEPVTPAEPTKKKMGLWTKVGIGFAVLVVLGIIGEMNPSDNAQQPAPVPASVPAAVVTTPSPPPAQEPAPVHRQQAPVQSAARVPAAPPPAVEQTPAPPPAAQQPAQPGDQSCGRPASVAGTWQWAIGDGAPGILVITQQGEALVVAEFNSLGQQIGMGAGSVCGRDVKIDISNALWGQFSIATHVSGTNAMSGTVLYQGQQAAMQAMRQG
jgi:outer membrane biosynthesis protein TonB